VSAEPELCGEGVVRVAVNDDQHGWVRARRGWWCGRGV
jgi:hypothetical protein